MKLSIIIPAFNAARFIERSVRSAAACAAQLGPGVSTEIVVVDHGSTDCTADAVPTDIKLRLLRIAPGGGPARAKNVGFEVAYGDLITFLDADDVMVDLKARVGEGATFGRIAGLIDENDAPIADLAFDSWVASSDTRNRGIGSIDAERIALSQLPGYFTLVYPRWLLERIGPGPFDESLDRAEDFDLAYRCALMLERDGLPAIKFVDSPCIQYRVHGNNASILLDSKGRIDVRPETRAAHQRALLKHGLTR